MIVRHGRVLRVRRCGRHGVVVPRIVRGRSIRRRVLIPVVVRIVGPTRRPVTLRVITPTLARLPGVVVTRIRIRRIISWSVVGRSTDLRPASAAVGTSLPVESVPVGRRERQHHNERGKSSNSDHVGDSIEKEDRRDLVGSQNRKLRPLRRDATPLPAKIPSDAPSVSVLSRRYREPEPSNVRPLPGEGSTVAPGDGSTWGLGDTPLWSVGLGVERQPAKLISTAAANMAPTKFFRIVDSFLLVPDTASSGSIRFHPGHESRV